MKLKNSKTKIISLLLLILLLFNFVAPLKSQAIPLGVSTIITKPICTFGMWILDAFNRLGAVLFTAEDDFEALEEELNDIKGDDDEFNAGDMAKFTQSALYKFLISPDSIFSGKVKFLNANIFTANENTTIGQAVTSGVGNELSGVLKKSVASIYVILRNICAVVMLCLLIYTGIRILITSASPYRQAEWKRVMLDWVKAICLLLFMHYIMVGIFYISDLLVDALRKCMGRFINCSCD